MRIPTDATKSENERQYGIIDQMLSMHSSFRDRMERRAFWLNTSLVASSLFLCIFAFVGDELLRSLNLDPAMTRFVLGLTAVFVLVFSITEFRVDWRTIAGRHAEAVSRLAGLKAKYRKSFAENAAADPKKNGRLTSEYNKSMSCLPAIPDRWFNKLKAEHRYKRILSERTAQVTAIASKSPTFFGADLCAHIEKRRSTDKQSSNSRRIRCDCRAAQVPKAPAWFLRLQLRLEGFREARQLAKERHNARIEDKSPPT